MALTVTHAKNVAIADDPKAAAAGEVLPSDWNANHTVTGVALENAGADQTFYVSTTGSDSADGSSATPFRTIQHAVSVGLGFDYQSLYTLTINVADGTYNESVSAFGILNGTISGTNPNAFLVGDAASPTSVKIAPNTGDGRANLQINGGFWQIDGFSFVADPNDTAADLLAAHFYSFLFLGTLDFDLGTGLVNQPICFSCSKYSRATVGRGSGSHTFSYHGNSSCGGIVNVTDYGNSNTSFITFDFSAATINLGGIAAFSGDNYCRVSIIGNTYTSPGNVTGGPPLGATRYTFMSIGADPTTITFPGGAFDPTQIDEISAIDAFYYLQEFAGIPAAANIYKGGWQVVKDTSGGGVYVICNDGGVIKKAALT